MKPLESRILQSISQHELVSPFDITSAFDPTAEKPELPEWVKNADMSAQSLHHLNREANLKEGRILIPSIEHPRFMHIVEMKNGEYVEVGGIFDSRDHDGSRAQRIQEKRQNIPTGVFRGTLY